MSLSLRSLFRELAIAQERLIDDQNRDMALAWRIGAFIGFRKLPPLKELLIRKRAPTLAQQFEQTMHNVSVVMGLDPKRVRLKRGKDGRCLLISQP